MISNILKKTSLVFLCATATLAVMACGTTTSDTSEVVTNSETEIPALSNPNSVFYDGGDYRVTYQEMYEEIKLNDGVSQLLDMIDRDLLSAYIAAVTEDEIADKVNYFIYGTDDPDEIAALSLEERTEDEENYDKNIFMVGYTDDSEEYAKLAVAKDKYALDAMLSDDNSAESWYVGPQTIAEYYEDNYRETLSAIKIRFMSQTEAKAIMASLNLVGISGKLYLYTGTKDISTVAFFNSTNTRLLEGDELVGAFAAMYNIVYDGYRIALATDLTYNDAVLLDDLVIGYDDITNASLRKLLFDSFGDMESYVAGTDTSQYYTYQPASYSTGYDGACYMVLNLKRTDNTADVSDFDGTEAELRTLIGNDLYDEIKDILIQENYDSSSFITARMADLREEHDLVIYDYYLGLDYESATASNVTDDIGSETIVASYDDTEITADELFYHAMNRNADVYLVHALQMEILVDRYFADIYCVGQDVCDYNVNTNTSDLMLAHWDDLDALETDFEESYYSYYYTFEEYIYLAYGARSDEEMLTNYYMEAELQPRLLYDMLQADDWSVLTDYLVGKIDEYYDNYFSLDVDQLLIYIDRNEDGAADDYSTFVASLADQSAFETMISDFETAIYAYMADEDNTFTTLESDYAKATYDDATWGVFKKYGLFLVEDELSSSNSLTYETTIDNYDEDFITTLQEAYAYYQLPENVDLEALLYQNPIISEEGIKILNLAPGDGFTKPSAYFEMTYDDENQPEYDTAFVNDSDELSIDQIKEYCYYRFIEMVYGTDEDDLADLGITLPDIPDSVMDALETYFADIHDSFYVTGSIYVIASEEVAANPAPSFTDPSFTFTSSEILADISRIHDIYFDTVIID